MRLRRRDWTGIRIRTNDTGSKRASLAGARIQRFLFWSGARADPIHFILLPTSHELTTAASFLSCIETNKPVNEQEQRRHSNDHKRGARTRRQEGVRTTRVLGLRVETIVHISSSYQRLARPGCPRASSRGEARRRGARESKEKRPESEDHSHLALALALDLDF